MTQPPEGQTTQVSGTWLFILVNESGWRVCDIQTDAGGGDGK